MESLGCLAEFVLGGKQVSELITDVEQVTPEWLTRVLQEKDYLGRGKVTAVRKKSRSTIISNIHHLELEYSAESPNSAPTRLFLKITKPDFDPEISSRIGKRESDFYNVIAVSTTGVPLISCYDAVYSPETGKSPILLADLSETHFQTNWPLPPTKMHCEEVMHSLAKFQNAQTGQVWS